MIAPGKETVSMSQAMSRLAAKAALRGADLALRVPILRNVVIEKLLGRLGQSYNDNEDDPDQHRHVVWAMSLLGPFLHRLVNDRFPGIAGQALAPGGVIYLRTDDRSYFEQMLAVDDGEIEAEFLGQFVLPLQQH